MKIQDVRFECSSFRDESERPLCRMFSDIGHHLLSKIKYQFEVEATNVLRFSCRNCDNNNFIEQYYGLGDGEFDHIGATTFNISENYFLLLRDEEKRFYLLDVFYKSIKDYAVYFCEETDLLDEAYHKLLESGFYRNSTGFIPTRNKLYRCWVEELLNFNNSDYRLAFQDNITKAIDYYMTNKKSVIFEPNCEAKVLLTTPQLFHVEGWNKNEFRVRWGEYGNELYIFDMKAKTLRMEIDEVELPDFLK